MPTPDALHVLFQVIDLLGVLANAVLGGMLARRAGLDRWASARSRSCRGWAAA